MFALYLFEAFEMGAGQAGLYFFILGLGYFVGCAIFDLLVRRFRRRAIMHFGAFLNSFGVCFIGPSALFGVPRNLILISGGLATAGFGCGLFLALLMQEKIQAAEHVYPGRGKKVSDLAAGIHSAGMSAGQVAAPLVGSWLYRIVGFRWSCDVMALALLGFAVVHIFFCDYLGKEEGGKASRPKYRYYA